MTDYILCVDIGGSHISSLTTKGEIRTTKVDAYADRDTILTGWVKHLRDHLAAEPGAASRTLAIAMPGPFDYAAGVARFQSGLKFGALRGLDLGEFLLGELAGVETVVFENDAACFGLGAFEKFRQSGYQRLLGITLGTGVGSSFVVNGRVVKSGPGIPPGGEIYQVPFHDGIADDYFGTRWFTHCAEERYGIIVPDLLALLDVSSPARLAQLFSDYSGNLLELLLPICQRFQPDALVLGGNIAHTYPRIAPAFAPRMAALGVTVHAVPEEAEYLTCLGAGQNALL